VQQRGRDLFFGKAGCNACHLGFNFTDGRFHNLGVGYVAPGRGEDPASGFADPGRYLVTKAPADVGAFKTPTLRDCSRHAPYMHDGSVATLREAVLLYDRGGSPNPWLSPEVRRLGLSPAEVDALVAFLQALDGEGWQDEPPRAFPR
jgi:cytochrome c peroxidase